MDYLTKIPQVQVARKLPYRTSLAVIVKTAKRSFVPNIRSECVTTPEEQRKAVSLTNTSNKKISLLNSTKKSTGGMEGLSDYLDLIESNHGYTDLTAIALITIIQHQKNNLGDSPNE